MGRVHAAIIAVYTDLRGGDVGMKIFFRLYGKPVCGVAATIMLAAALGVLISRGWNMYGVFRNTKIDMISGRGKNQDFEADRPVLYAKSMRVKQGSRLLLSEIAAARDVDGASLCEQIQFIGVDEQVKDGAFDTSAAGCFPVKVSVRSAATGRLTAKNITILVDGRPQ